MRNLLRIPYLKHKTNNWMRSKTNFLVGPQEPLLATVKRRKLARFGHVTHYSSLSKTILQGTLQRKCLMANIQERTSLPMPEPCKFSFLDSCQKRFLRSHKAVDLAPHPDVGRVVQAGSVEKLTQAPGFESLLRLTRC